MRIMGISRGGAGDAAGGGTVLGRAEASSQMTPQTFRGGTSSPSALHPPGSRNWAHTAAGGGCGITAWILNSPTAGIFCRCAEMEDNSFNKEERLKGHRLDAGILPLSGALDNASSAAPSVKLEMQML